MMAPRTSLQTTLYLLLALCLVLVLLIQLAVRYLVELPQLRAQEYANDVSAVKQLQQAFALEMTRKGDLLYDNAHWNGAYQFIQQERGSEAYERFVEEEYMYSETMHVVPRVDGYIYFKPDGERLFESNVDSRTLEESQSLPLPLSLLATGLPEDLDSYHGGFADSAIGPVFFVITGITDNESALPRAGYLVAWRRADEHFFKELVGVEGVDFKPLAPGGDADIVAAIRGTSDAVLPRREGDYVQWNIDDVRGEPLFLVRQTIPPRTFYDGPISLAGAVAFVALAVLLLVFAWLLSRRVIRPILELGRFAKGVAESEDYSRRIPVKHEDEIGVVARRFDQLLGRVESQEKTLKTQNSELEALSERDSLTDVYNRRVFERTLERDWLHCMRAQRPLSCVLIDIDYFKSYNDHYGHQAGDEVLQTVAAALGATINRATDTFCRYGGEEFAALMMETDHGAAIAMAERMVQAIRDLAIPHECSQCAEYITISAGIATVVPQQQDVASSLVKAGDLALYQAKERGRNQLAATNMDPSDQKVAVSTAI